MNVRLIAFVGFRLLAAYLLAVYGVPALVQALALFSGNSSPEYRQFALVTGLNGLLIFVVAAVLWYGARGLSARLVRGLPETLDETTVFRQWQALIMSGLGWYCLLIAMHMFDKVFQAQMNRSSYDMTASDDVLTLLIKAGAFYFVVGLILVLLPRTIGGALDRLRAWGAGQAFTGDRE